MPPSRSRQRDGFADFRGRTLLITGGTGSFGGCAVRRFLKTDIGEIRVFSRDEKKQDDMRHELQTDRVKFVIGDVRSYDSIASAMHGVDFVFSAAALKQVPSCEFYPMEAVRTNVIGTDHVIRAAEACGVRNVIVLSTDKAVYPINAMGMSKALMEKVAVAYARNWRKGMPVVCVTRYGNVMASRGSVIPLFVNQIKAGRPITATDPEMTRFMMTLDEAIDLVVYAFRHGRPGDTFVRKAPAARIGQLARVLMKIFGRDVPIRIIGTRHGEKKHETLLNREELVRAEDMGAYFRVQADTRNLNYAIFFERGETKVSREEDYTSANTHALSDAELEAMLRRLDFIQKELAEWGR